MINKVGRDIPDELIGRHGVYMGAGYRDGEAYTKSGVNVRICEKPQGSKLVGSIREAIEKCGMKDGMTVSFHHHFRDGDYVASMVMKEIKAMGIKDVTIAASSLGTAHDAIADMIEEGIVTGIQTSGIRGRLGEVVSAGKLKTPAVIRSHGGRVRAIEEGDVHIDIAFIGAPTADEFGNARAVGGKSDCGVLSYAMADAKYADHVVIITDTLVPSPNLPASIQGIDVDYVVCVDAIGDPAKIAAKAARMTNDVRELTMAARCADVMAATPYFADGFTFQTGAGGPSLAVNRYLEPKMKAKNITMRWALGGISAPTVALLESGLVNAIIDTQDFDQVAVKSAGENARHFEISASQYANPANKGAFVNQLDFVILAALEVDTDFNVNVLTGSDGVLRGAPGGHPDAAAGAKCCIIVTPLMRGRMATICEHVVTVTTPGECVDVVVTDHGIAVNPSRPDIAAWLDAAGIEHTTIEKLKELAYSIVGTPEPLEWEDKVVAVLEARDGSILDVVRQIKPYRFE